jgi:Tol biopolymer transport system component
MACMNGKLLLGLVFVLAEPTVGQQPRSGPWWTERASVGEAGVQGDGDCLAIAMAADGRHVAFASSAGNLVAGDANEAADVFVRDILAGTTECVSVDSAGGLGNRDSLECAISADGRHVAFRSLATNLVASDANGTWDIFVHDRASGTTTRVSVDEAGDEANRSSSAPTLSADGRFVAFSSSASDLVPLDTNALADIFVHDRLSGTTTRASVASGGAQSDGHSLDVALSADGRHVAFASYAANLVPADTNGRGDIFVHDRVVGTTARVSLASAGLQADGESFYPALSADGRWVGYTSSATNLVIGDTNGWADVFVHDLTSGVTERVSLGSSGNEANDGCYGPSFSADGRFVAFGSEATNLVPADGRSGWDAFVRDRQTNRTVRSSVDVNGRERADFGLLRKVVPRLSSSGRQIALISSAPLDPFDENRLADAFVRRLY